MKTIELKRPPTGGVKSTKFKDGPEERATQVNNKIEFKKIWKMLDDKGTINKFITKIFDKDVNWSGYLTERDIYAIMYGCGANLKEELLRTALQDVANQPGSKAYFDYKDFLF